MNCKITNFIALLMVALSLSGYAQTAVCKNVQLEMTGSTTGAVNPTTNGPLISNQIITFRNNTDNPSGNTFANYTTPSSVTATYSISNQQYTSISGLSGVYANGIVFGGNFNSSAAAIYPTLGALSNSVASNFSSSPHYQGSGIDLTNNRGVELFFSTRALQNNSASLTGTFLYGNLTITFSEPVDNPILNFADFGGGTSGHFFSMQAEVTSGQTLTRLSGDAEVTLVGNNYISSTVNSTDFLDGSFMVNEKGVTAITFRLYIKGHDSSGVWSGIGANITAGESIIINVTLPDLVPDPISPNNVFLYADCPSNTINLTTATPVAPQGLTYEWHSVASSPTNATKFTNITSVPANSNIYLYAKDNISGCYSTATAFTTYTACVDSDGDGIVDWIDLDDDNDGILDADECQSSNKITDGIFPTSGATIPNWTTTGSFALNVRGLQFDADNAVTTVKQTVSSVFSGSKINLKNVRWLTTNNTTDGRLITEILYNGTVYATINTDIGVAGSIPTVVGNNGAITNISTLPSIASTGVYSTPSNIIITLPFSLPSSGEFQMKFTSLSSNADDISIESVELISCSDYDADGIPNYLDLDSDGDGCSDAVEGAGNFTTSQLTTASGTLSTQSPNINFGTTVDANGIPTIVGASGQGIGDSLDGTKDCKDSDGDGIPDWQDLDDDNDGILDCVENGLNTTVDKIFKANNSATLIASPSSGPVHQYRLTNSGNQNGQVWSYGKVDFTKSFTLSTKVLLSGADGIAIVFHNSAAGQLASGANGQGLGARGIANGIALELDTFANSCVNDANNGANCDPTNDHGSIRTTADWINAGKLAGDTQLGDGTVDDGLWHDVVINWNSVARNLSYTFDGAAVTNYTFPATGTNAIETILAGNSAYFGFTASTGGLGSNNSVGFDSLCTLPIYLDTDNDGISNHLDLDSDGDGCTDAIEGVGNFTTSQLTTASGSISTQNPNQNFGISVDVNGIPTTVGAAGQGIGNSQDISKNDCIDSDGDGYPDWQDLDDDNDGILDTVECSVTDLVTNGTFTGNANGWTLETGWSYDNTNKVKIESDFDTVRLLQSVNNLNKMPGNIVPLTFTLGAQDAGNASGNVGTLEVRLNGLLYATINNDNLRNNANITISLEPKVVSNFTTFGTSALSGYTTRTFTIWIPYTGPSTANLVFRKVGGGDDWSVDDVSIPAMLCDTDGDGILDHLDLDSDGDGCPDAIEGSADFFANNLVNSSMPGGNTGGSYTGTAGPVSNNLGNTVGNTAATMGVPTIAGTGQGVGGSKIATNYSQCLDSDGDGVPDYIDLDDDNDGILDTVEMCKSSFVNFTGTGSNFQQLLINNVDGLAVVSTTASITPAVTDYYIGWHMGNATTTVGKEMSINFSNPVYLANDGVDFALGGMDANSKFGNFFIVYEDGTRQSNLNLSLANVSPVGNLILSTINGASAVQSSGSQASANLTLLAIDRTKRIVKMGYTVHALNGGAFSENVSPRIQIDCDVDGDGIPNQLDLDSDNDGCLDAIEGGANITTSQLVNSGGVLSVGTGSSATNQNLCANNTCVDANGVPTIVNGGQTAGTSTNKDIQDVVCLTPFDCTSGMYLSQGNPTVLYRVDTTNNPLLYPTSVDASSGLRYNSIGFNPIDGFIYGLLSNTNTVIRIDKNGVFNIMGNLSTLAAANYNSGEIDNLGNYYVKVGGANAVLYKINLQTLTSTTITLNQNISISDLAFSSLTNMLYSVDQTTAKLVSINPTTGAVTFIGAAMSPSVFGAMFGSNIGAIYGSDNSGGLYKFNIITGDRVLISSSPGSNNNDGAHCVTAPITFAADLEVTKTDNKTIYIPGTNNIYTIVVKNNGPFGV